MISVANTSTINNNSNTTNSYIELPKIDTKVRMDDFVLEFYYEDDKE